EALAERVRSAARSRPRADRAGGALRRRGDAARSRVDSGDRAVDRAVRRHACVRRARCVSCWRSGAHARAGSECEGARSAGREVAAVSRLCGDAPMDARNQGASMITNLDSPIGTLAVVVREGKLVELHFGAREGEEGESEIANRVRAYFAGDLSALEK